MIEYKVRKCRQKVQMTFFNKIFHKGKETWRGRKSKRKDRMGGGREGRRRKVISRVN